ncbi:MAG: recombination protein RecR [Anaerolineales bacterium]|nr:recombination protein RecR [Anaerolineales bacterium]
MSSLTVPKAVQRLIDELSRLPGIGPKSASRLTFFLLRGDGQQPQDLAAALLELREQTRFCSVCFNIADVQVDPCRVCADPNREAGLICVVEEPLDALAIERTGQFKGRYHVLHGAISPVEGVGPEDLRIHELVVRVQTAPVREVILATNISLEGEATAMYIQRQLVASGAKVTRLARGLPVGGDLEYADETTLSRALDGRREM